MQFLGAFNDNVFKQSIIFYVTFHLITTIGKETADLYVSLGAALFLLPSLLFSTYSAEWADKAGKSRVIVKTKILEIFIMILGGVSYYLLNPKSPNLGVILLLFTLFLMGAQSAIFSPSKYGIMPEILSPGELTNGNGLLEMGTFIAILLGAFLGGQIIHYASEFPYVTSAFCIVISVIGYLSSRSIPKTKPVSPELKFDLLFWRKIWKDFKGVKKNRVIYLTILGISSFWFFGAIYLQIIPGLGVYLGANATQTNCFLVAFSVGIGLGSMLCDRLSDGKVEMGLIPFGAVQCC